MSSATTLDASLDAACDACGDYRLSRRQLLQRAAIAGAAGVMTSVVGDAVTQTVFGATAGDDNVLVLLSLRGGADGLSMVVPHADWGVLDATRRSLLVKREQLLATDGTFGLHPRLEPLVPLWTSGRLAAIQAVGLPQPNRSHFEAMELIEDADPTSSERRGWINRMIGQIAGSDPFQGVHLTSPQAPTALYGPEPTVAATDLGQLTIPLGGSDEWGRKQKAAVRSALSSMYSSGPLASAGRGAINVADRASSATSAASAKPANGAAYRDDSLGKSLSRSAAVIRAGLGARAISIDYGTWDHHEGLPWRMPDMIGSLAANLAAFFTDLGTAGTKVTVVTLSEFGRRVAVNGSTGLDHGYGNCVFVAGGGVAGGKYYGRWPGLGTTARPADDLMVTTDWRLVLSEILDRRFPSVNLGTVFPGLGYSRDGRMGFMA